jgi:hypothetical protein
MSPSTNGDLHAALTTAKAAWAECAAKVDMIAFCQAQVRQREAAALLNE